eukprot:3514332-Pyramimonas_sp.AAC.1
MARWAEPEPMKHGIGRAPTQLAGRANSVHCFSSSGPSPRGITSRSLGTTSLARRALLGAERGCHHVMTNSSSRNVR